ncbi:hypothetical protein F5141DRAFT_1231360 [Pisolithus sp. B1]|nr:hypothetical protein F5141DRAFT_1231360 [Pisolithus sp. B1]
MAAVVSRNGMGDYLQRVTAFPGIQRRPGHARRWRRLLQVCFLTTRCERVATGHGHDTDLSYRWGPPSQAASEEVPKLPVSLGSTVPYVVMYSRIQSSRASTPPNTTTLTLATAMPRHNATPQVILLRVRTDTSMFEIGIYQERLTSSDQTKFSSRMRALTDSVHALGCNAGIVGYATRQRISTSVINLVKYSDAGWFTCQLYPGSYQNEERDARLFRDDWGFDYLKYATENSQAIVLSLFRCDNCAVLLCNITRQDIMGRLRAHGKCHIRLIPVHGETVSRFAPMRIRKGIGTSVIIAGRDMVRVGGKVSTPDDISPTWLCVASIIKWLESIRSRHTSEKFRYDFKPTPLSFRTYEESETHIIAWALMKSPVLIGDDVQITSLGASDQSIETLTNREIIAINQDAVVGAGVTTFRWGVNYYSGESQNGTIFMLASITFSLEEMASVMKVTNQIDAPAKRATTFFNPAESPWIPAGRQYFVRDLWAHSNKGTAVRNFTANDVPLQGVVPLLLQDAGDEPEA